MQVNVHGSLHKDLGIKNQDACRDLQNEDKTKKVRIVCDGCTNIDVNDPKSFLKTHSEVGAGLFCSLYETIDNPYDEEKFPEKAEFIVRKMLSLIDFDKEKLEGNQKIIDYIFSNYCFTILACFETENEFIVYCLGDGVIMLINHFDVITYIDMKKNKYPSYIINNFLVDEDKKISFEKFVFCKEDFKNVGIASDGIQCVIGKELSNLEKLEFDNFFVRKSNTFFEPEKDLTNFITKKQIAFGDDTTVVW